MNDGARGGEKERMSSCCWAWVPCGPCGTGAALLSLHVSPLGIFNFPLKITFFAGGGFFFNVITVKYKFSIKYIVEQNKSRPNRHQDFHFGSLRTIARKQRFCSF